MEHNVYSWYFIEYKYIVQYCSNSNNTTIQSLYYIRSLQDGGSDRTGTYKFWRISPPHTIPRFPYLTGWRIYWHFTTGINCLNYDTYINKTTLHSMMYDISITQLCLHLIHFHFCCLSVCISAAWMNAFPLPEWMYFRCLDECIPLPEWMHFRCLDECISAAWMNAAQSQLFIRPNKILILDLWPSQLYSGVKTCNRPVLYSQEHASSHPQFRSYFYFFHFAYFNRPARLDQSESDTIGQAQDRISTPIFLNFLKLSLNL